MHSQEDQNSSEGVLGAIRWNRRQLLVRSLAAGLSLPAISALLAACGGDDDDDDSDEGAATTEATDAAEESATTEEATEESGDEGSDSQGDDNAPAGDRKVLRIGIKEADIGTLDPHFSATVADRVAENLVFNGLIRYKPGNSTEYEADIAEAIPEPETVDGKQVWTFTLRKGVMWHPGPSFESYELTADDVVASFTKASDTEQSAFAVEYDGIEVAKVDDYTVTFTLEQPLSSTLFLPKIINWTGGCIMSKKAIDSMSLEEIKTHPIGTGPFRFVSYRSQDRIVYEAWDDFYRGTPKLAGVEVRFIADVTTGELALQSGELDSYHGLTEVQWIDRLNNVDGIAVDVFGVGQVAWMTFNVTDDRLKDLKVRQALAYAVNRDNHIALFGGPPAAEKVYSVVPSQFMPGGLNEEQATEAGVDYTQDIDKAKQLLEEAGVTEPLQFTLVASEQEIFLRNYEALQAEYQELGVEVELDVVDNATYHSLIRQDASPIVIYVAFRPNADLYLTQGFHSDSIIGTGASPVINFSHYGEIDDLILDARYETDDEKQAEIWRQANIKILEDMAAFPIHFINLVYARSDKLDYGHELISSLSLGPEITELTTISD